MSAEKRGRPEMLASAFDSGVDAVLQRPLQKSVVTACVGEVLRRQANIEFVYKVTLFALRSSPKK